jgi:predicted RNA-binding Zn-ribbon protein involved in translation (DUF1610 family)
VAEPSTLGETVRRWERWTDAAHRYVLPVASAAGLGLAGAIAVGAPKDVVAYAPWALAALGAGALATSLGYHRWHTHVESAHQRTTPRATPRPAALVTPRSDLDPSHEWNDLVRRAWHTPVAPSVRAEVPPPAPGSAAGAIWSQWQPTAVSELPVRLVGPVPETAWFPTAPGETPRFPEKEPGFIVLDGKLAPLSSVATPPAEPLGPASPVDAEGIGTARSVETDVVDSPTEWFPESNLTLESSTSGWSGFLGPLDELAAEALHPVPPHLRISPTSGAVEFVPPPPPRLPEVEPDSPPSFIDLAFAPEPMCSSCSRDVRDPEQWRPCPECGGPVCLACRTQAVVYYGHTWCASCAVGRGWDHPLVLEAPERFPAIFGTTADRFPSYGSQA